MNLIEHLQCRSPMYIGNSDEVIYYLIKDIINVSDKSNIKIDVTDNKFQIRDCSNSISFDAMIEYVTQSQQKTIHSEVAINAFSTKFSFTSYQNKAFKKISFGNGVLLKEEIGVTNEEKGTLIEFELNMKYFSHKSFDLKKLDDILISNNPLLNFKEDLGVNMTVNIQKDTTELTIRFSEKIILEKTIEVGANSFSDKTVELFDDNPNLYNENATYEIINFIKECLAQCPQEARPSYITLMYKGAKLLGFQKIITKETGIGIISIGIL